MERRPTELLRRALRPPRVDLLAAAACVTIGVLLYVADGTGDGLTGRGADVAPLAPRLAVLVVAGAAQTFRRRRPGPALAVCAAATAVDAALAVALGDGALHLSIPLILILADLLFSAVAYGSARLSRGVTAGWITACAVGTVMAAVLAPDWRAALWWAFQAAVILPTPVWWGAGIRQHRELAEAERDRARQLLRLAELDRRTAVDAERCRMAQDLHDVVAGHVSAIALQSEAALTAPGAPPGTDRAVLRAVRESSLEALRELRAMIDLLRAEAPPAAGGDPRLAGVDRLVAAARAAGLRVSAEGTPPPALPPDVDLAAYRILQEALTNAALHAAGAETRVRLGTEEGRFVVEVANDLPGPGDRVPVPAGAGTGSGTGLPSMRERARGVGGTLTAGPDGDHWRVRAVLPV